MNMTEYVCTELLFLIPFLNVFGWWIKHKTSLPNNYIPLILGIVSIILCICYMRASMGKSIEESVCGGILQGVFVAATAVYANQLSKTKAEEKQ